IPPDFPYAPGATDGATSVDEVLRGRRGVCQDFAHVQLACLRAFGLAARYVSGYLVTHHAVDEKALLGADASHAWVSVRLPGGAWLDLDPTNDVVPTDRHIVVAISRDFGDVTPMRGEPLGGGGAALGAGGGAARADRGGGREPGRGLGERPGTYAGGLAARHGARNRREDAPAILPPVLKLRRRHPIPAAVCPP